MSNMLMSRGERIFGLFNGLFMILFSLSILWPFVHLLAVSLSDKAAAVTLGLKILPQGFTLSSYEQVFESEFIWKGYKNTIFRTVIGTAFSLVLTAFGGYALSKKYFPNRTLWTALIVFTMFFSGGLIPTYFLIKSLGLLNTRAVMIIPGAVSAFNMLIMRNYFMTLPVSIEESGLIDGASQFRVLFALILPLSSPMLATIGLWIAVAHWNAWFDCLIYIRDIEKWVVQIILRRIIHEGTADLSEHIFIMDEELHYSPMTIKAAAIFVITTPILVVYPFIQKYFVKGIMIGSLKG